MAKACVAYVHSHDVATAFTESLLGLVMYDASTDGHLTHADGKIAVRCATNGLVQARNAAVKAFLETDAEYLFFLDTDMGFPRDALSRLLAVADPAYRPIVGALCFSSREIGFDGLGGYRTLPRPTVYDWVTVDGRKQFAGRVVYPVNELVRCSATGSACIVIHRSVFERIDAYLVEHGKPAGMWYEPMLDDAGNYIGEDISLCARAAIVGAPTHVLTGVRTTHYKPMWLGESHYWAQHPAPPATERTAVVVPVLGRPHHAAPFMASLRASTGLATAYAICDRNDRDAIAAWRKAGAVIRHCPPGERPGTFAEKVNIGFRHTREPWVFITGSDVHFWPGWLDHAQHVAESFDAHVIGTNDLGNPRVLNGEHATHIMLSREYVTTVGGGWDGPGTLAHEGYHHNYVDDEIVQAAKHRGVWQMALGSRVEHMHPLWDKAPLDSVYSLGAESVEADKALFALRSVANRGSNG